MCVCGRQGGPSDLQRRIGQPRENDETNYTTFVGCEEETEGSKDFGVHSFTRVVSSSLHWVDVLVVCSSYNGMVFLSFSPIGLAFLLTVPQNRLF